jgi:spore coat protein U domain-containing protein, fimbrial subunit CupE1/2/3/6
MSYRKSALTKAAVALIGCVGVVGSSWAAGSATQNITVNASVVQKCTISTTNVTLNGYDPLGANASAPLDNSSTGAGTVVLTCTNGSTSAVNIGLGPGSNSSHAVTTSRALANGSNYMDYDLYKPSGTTAGAACASPVTNGTTVWGNSGTGLLTPTGVTWGKSSPQTFYVCGSIPGGLDPVQGSYTDTVVATVNF